MAGRSRLPRLPDSYRGFPNVQPVMDRGPRSLPHHSSLEEELEIQHREMQRMVAENRLIIDDNTLLQRELTAAKDEINRLGQLIPKLRADKEAQARELIQRGLKLEAELRAVEPLKAEVKQFRSEVHKLNAVRQDLSAQVQALTKDITRLQSENQQLNAMRADIEGLHKELADARRAFEFEKKSNEEQVEQKLAMEKNLVSMAREIEKLRAEKLNAERRSQGFGSMGYGMVNGSPEMRYPGSVYDDTYSGLWRSYDKRARR